MSKRDFFILLIKVFGLYSAVTTIFSGLPSNVIFGMHGEVEMLMYAWAITVIAVVAGLFWLLTFKADKVVDFLKLTKGFSDDRIELGDIKADDIINIAVFIIGGLLVIQNTPWLLSRIFWAIKGEGMGQEFTSRDTFNLGVSAINVLIGILLVTNYGVVARLFTRKKERE